MRTGIFEKSKTAERGASALTLIIFGALLIAAVYSASKILPFYYYYYDLQNQMASLIMVAQDNTDQQIRKKLLYFLRKAEIPFNEKDLIIKRSDTGNMMSISLPYKEVFYIPWGGKDYVIHVFEFYAHAEGKF